MTGIVYDTTQIGRRNLWLSTWWWLGATVLLWLGLVDFVVGAASWEEAFARIAQLPERPLRLARYWGHGSEARPQIAGQGPNLYRLRDAWGIRLVPGSMHWFQMCSVLRGEKGQQWALTATGILGIVVGHVAVISQAFAGPRWEGRLGRLLSGLVEGLGVLLGVCWHSGGYGLRPGQRPHWSTREGGYSFLWNRHTAGLLRSAPPPGWFQ